MKTKQIILSGLFIALGIILPFFTGQIGAIGAKLLPMHFPVIIAGFVLGPTSGLMVGLITPLIRSILLTMPTMFPTAIAMAFELGAYGLCVGLIYKIFKSHSIIHTYMTLIISMIVGRLVWGVISVILYSMTQTSFGFEMFIAGAFLNAIPGIILQLIIIPILITVLKQNKLMK